MAESTCVKSGLQLADEAGELTNGARSHAAELTPVVEAGITCVRLGQNGLEGLRDLLALLDGEGLGKLAGRKLRLDTPDQPVKVLESGGDRRSAVALLGG